MSDQTKAPIRRKTVQAIKISASWTPIGENAAKLAENAFGAKTPLHFAGGQLSVKAAIAADMTDPTKMVHVSQRVAELRGELAATGTLHSFSTQAGAVPVGMAESIDIPKDDAHEPYVEDVANKGATA